MRKLAVVLFAGVLVTFSIGCQKREDPDALPPLPKIPKEYESKPGFGGMGGPAADETKPATDETKPATDETKPATDETKPATEPPKPDAPEAKVDAPADAGAAAGAGDPPKSNL